MFALAQTSTISLQAPILSGSSTAFVIANLLIVFGYVFAAIYVAPSLPVSKMTRTGAILFFFTCGLTHLEQVYHAIITVDAPYSEIAQDAHMLLIHIPQALAIWFFLLGFRRDIKKLITQVRESEREALEARRAFEDARAAEASLTRLREEVKNSRTSEASPNQLRGYKKLSG